MECRRMEHTLRTHVSRNVSVHTHGVAQTHAEARNPACPTRVFASPWCTRDAAHMFNPQPRVHVCRHMGANHR